MSDAPSPGGSDPGLELSLEGHTLWVAADYEQALRRELAPHLRAPEGAPGAEVIKHNRVRTVVRVETSAGELFFKRFRVKKTFDRLLHTLKPSPARREWRGLRHLEAAGIAVPRPVLFGEERQGGTLRGSVLATVAVAGAEELTSAIDRLRAAADEEQRPLLLAGLAAVIVALFEAGADHPDLHLGNFLLAPPGPGDSEGAQPAPPRLISLDLHSLRLRAGPLSPARRRQRLEKLAHSCGVCDPDDRPEGLRELDWFCAAYARLDPAVAPLAGDAESLALALRAGAERLEARRLVSRDRRCLVDSTSFAVEREPERLIYRRREVSREALLAAVQARPLAEVHAHPKGRSRIVRVARPEGFPGAGPLIVKHYGYPQLRRRIAAMAAPLALRAWRAARACEVRRAPTPLHYGLVLEGRAWPRGAALVMELLEDVTMIHVLLEQGGFASAAARRALARAVGRVMGRFHQSGLIHHDLAVQNLLVRAGGPAGWEVWVIDLDEG